MKIALPLCALIALSGPAAAQDPDDYDPILDGQSAEGGGSEPITPADPAPIGLMIGAGGSLYFGRVRSYLDPDVSRLESGLYPGISIGLSGRTQGGWEIGIDAMVGFGRTYEPDEGYIGAFDVIVEPRVLYHYVDQPGYGLYAGLGGSAWLFDVEGAGINQGGVGPTGTAGLIFARDLHGHLYLEISGTALYDFLAYRYEDPTPDALAAGADPDGEKVEGQWFMTGRVTVGYRLTNF